MVNKLITLTAACLLLFSSGVSLAADISAKLDRNIISINETATLLLQGEDYVEIPAATLSQLQKNFSVRHAGKNSQTSCRNFSCTSTTTVSYELTPKNIGLFAIPAMEINGSKTPALQLTVKAANNNPNSGNVDPVFIETDIDKQEAFVQEQIVLTFKINNAIDLRDLSLEEEFLIEDAIVKLINQTSYERHINGRLYNTTELSYSVLPQKSGTLTIPSINIQALVSKGGFRTQRIRLVSDAKDVDIKANPTTSDYWLPAKHLQISETWSADINEIKVGDSITRTITTTAVGLAAEQLPPIEIETNGQFKAYSDQAKMEDKKNAQGIVGVRTDSIAIVATQVGKIELPAINIQWWDIKQKKSQTTTLPAITLTVLPNANVQVNKSNINKGNTASFKQPMPEAVNAPSPENTAAPENLITLKLWQGGAILSFIGMLLFAFLYLRQLNSHRRDTQKPASGPQQNNTQLSLKALEKACLQADAQQLRQQLLAWGKVNWPNQSIHSTMDIAQQCKDSALQDELKKLDAALYTTQSQLKDFSALFELLKKHDTSFYDSKETQQLAQLYPVK